MLKNTIPGCLKPTELSTSSKHNKAQTKNVEISSSQHRPHKSRTRCARFTPFQTLTFSRAQKTRQITPQIFGYYWPLCRELKRWYAGTMSTKESQLDWREGRRRRAWELKQQGWKQSNIAAALGVTPGAVSQWIKRVREQGVEALRRRPAPGRQPRLTPEQITHLLALLAPGPEAYGFRGQVWTCRRVAEVIRRTFGVTYHSAHVSRLLHTVRHSVQRPVVRATRARRGGHPGVVAGVVAGARKKATEEGRTIVWTDQSGFYLLPLAVRTWAPCGQTPVLHVPLTHDHLAAISGITRDGRLFIRDPGPCLPLARCRPVPAPEARARSRVSC
jgi:transposase